jgi:hypothetical protein
VGGHDDQVCVESGLSVSYSRPWLAYFDHDGTVHLRRYGCQHLLDVLARELNLRLEHFASGNTFGRSLIDQRIDLHDMENDHLAAAIQSERRRLQ